MRSEENVTLQIANDLLPAQADGLVHLGDPCRPEFALRVERVYRVKGPQGLRWDRLPKGRPWRTAW